MSDSGAVTPCYHCGEPSEPGYEAELEGASRAFCCAGCQAVASAISAGGLGEFYRYRDRYSQKPELDATEFAAFDLEDVQKEFVREVDDGREAVLVLGGISCAACAWLIEHHLGQLDGVARVRVNVANHLASITWNPAERSLSSLLFALHQIGYQATPGSDEAAERIRQKERRNALVRIGVAGLGMMQVGMVAIALHAGTIQGIEANWQHFLRWISLLFALPVMGYSAQPFFISAWRSLRARQLNMDVSVSLALALAFAASVVGTVRNVGEVYFDSVSMFTFFLLVGRYLEMRARHTSLFESQRLSQLLPRAAEKKADTEWALVPLSALKPGDHVRVRAGEVVPVDGLLLSAHAATDESMLTGESEPVRKNAGDALYAGSVLGDVSVELEVRAIGEGTRLDAVQKLLDAALSEKPRQQALADRVARYFVAAVLVVFAAVYGTWLWVDADRAFWVALSVLVVTCPCALSLATPAALAAGLNGLRRWGFLLVSPSALSVLPRLTHVIFDKTGTLTEGRPHIAECRVLGAEDEADVLNITASLERYSRHPLAQAFAALPASLAVESVRTHPGQGIAGQINGADYRFGLAEFAMTTPPPYPGTGSWQLLSRDGEALAWFRFEDAPRADAREALAALQAQGLGISLLSGDRTANVKAFVERHFSGFHFTAALGGQLPQDKLDALRARRDQGEVVMMVGDGINDVPVLSAADVSVAMGGASHLARVSADAVLLNQRLRTLVEVRPLAQRIQTVIRQNFAWALGYNLLALPLAAAGLIPPYLAALGMSASSLVVVLNSLRLGRTLRR